jgi:hypothetical protein
MHTIGSCALVPVMVKSKISTAENFSLMAGRVLKCDCTSNLQKSRVMMFKEADLVHDKKRQGVDC